jgi:hypothetical protein
MPATQRRPTPRRTEAEQLGYEKGNPLSPGGRPVTSCRGPPGVWRQDRAICGVNLPLMARHMGSRRPKPIEADPPSAASSPRAGSQDAQRRQGWRVHLEDAFAV